MTKQEKVIRTLTESIERAQDKHKAFIESFQKNPAYALEWSNDIFDYAAELKVYSIAIEALKAPEALENMRDFAKERVSYHIRNPQRSTSQQSNLIFQSEGRAWGQLLELIENSLKR
jgi:hypothetical protein